MSVPAVNQSAAWFVQELTAARVFEPAQLAPYLSEFRTLHPGGDAIALAGYLVKSGLLSGYQAERVLAGEAGRLVLGPYLLAGPIGSGSFGDVFLAVGRSDRKRYAVKVLPLRSLWNVRQAKAQLAAFARLPEHPAVVPFVDVDSAGGSHYLVWPFVEGLSLARRVREKGPASSSMAVALMAQAAEGLAICHAGGIAHGLFNPSNVLIGPDGRVRILDLGVGAILSDNIADDESMLDTMSSANATMGMLECCAPETLNSPTLRDPAGDAYSFGCVFYFLLTGSLPFPDGNVVDKVLAHQTQPPPSARDHNPAVPEWLDRLICRLMSKSPADRPASMSEILTALRAEPIELTPEPPPALAPKPQVQVETPRLGPHTTPPRPRATAASESDIDFGEYAVPPEASEHDWTTGRHATAVPAEPPPDRRPPPRTSIKLPSPVSYTHLPVATGPPAAVRPPRRRPWWARLLSGLRPWRPALFDVVQLSVFGPAAVSPGENLRLQVFAHTPDTFDSVNTLSRAFHADSGLLATGYVTEEIERGTPLTLHVRVTNAGVSHSSLEVTWLGQPQPRAFDVHVPWESPAGRTPVTLAATVAGRPACDVGFQLLILPRRG